MLHPWDYWTSDYWTADESGFATPLACHYCALKETRAKSSVTDRAGH